MDEPVQRVLVVDDDESSGLAVARVVRRMGVEPVLTTDGAAALELAERTRPEVCLVDIRMPAMDGHTFMRRLKSLRLDAAVVMMSGAGTMDDVIDAVRNGAVDFVRKPWTVDELMAAVARALTINEERRAVHVAPAVAAGAPAQAAQEPSHNIIPDVLVEVVERVRRGEIAAPAAPVVLAEIRARGRRDNVNISELVTLIEREPLVASGVLGLANSALLRGRESIVDLHTAVTRLGLRRVLALVETVLSHGLFQLRHPEAKGLVSGIWRHSVARACYARLLATHVRTPVDPDLAYLTGLLSDLGASFLVRAATETMESRKLQYDVHAMVALLRVHHQRVAAVLVQTYGLPDEVARVAGIHHTAPDGRDSLLAVTVLASQLASSVAPDPTGEPNTLAEAAVTARTMLGFEQTQLEALRTGAVDELKDFLSSFDTKTKG